MQCDTNRRRIRGAVAHALALALCLPLLASAEDARALSRFKNSPAEPVAATDWYTPTVDIGQGAGAPLRESKAAERSVEAAALDAALKYAQDKNSYGLIVAHRGVIQFEYYKDGFGPERLLDSQSLHKPLSAILTMAAVADGKVSLDDPLGKYIRRWRDDARGRITVRDVLYMQTGLVEPKYEEKYDNAAYRMFITSRLEDAVLALTLEDPPGTHYRSHYAATQLLQFVIEGATGKRYADYLRERLWSKLGGGHARVRLDRPGGNAQVLCCLQARPRDWLRVGLMLANHGQYDGQTLLPMDAFLQLTTPSTMAPNFAMQQIWRGSPYSRVRMGDSRNPNRGLPMSAPFLADDVFYLEGRGGQRVYVVPSRELVVVRQGEVRMEWDDAAFLNGLIAGVDRIPRTARPGMPMPPLAWSALLAPPAPDYTRAENWARRPPANLPQAAGKAKATAAFYIHPTTYSGTAWWNAPDTDPAVRPGVDSVVLGQASVLDGCCEVYAPLYRQAQFAALGVSMLPYELAYLDVRAAFRQFLAEIGDRPFIVLGHSQGALHTQHLVTDLIDGDPALARRLVAAYVIGIPVADALYVKTLKRLRPCTTATQTGCIASWATYSTAALPGLAQARAGTRARFAALMQEAGTQMIQCTNPLTWAADERAADAALNLGATMPDRATNALLPAVAGLVGAQCDDGMLIVTPEPPPPFSTLAFTGGNYHLADVALFHANVARNVAERAAAWKPR